MKKTEECIFPNNPLRDCRKSECCNEHSAACCIACSSIESCFDMCLFVAEKRLAQAEAERRRRKALAGGR